MFQSQCVTLPLNPTLSLGVEHDGAVHCVKGRLSGKGIPWTEYTVKSEYHGPSTRWEQNTMDRVHGGNKYHGPRTLWEQNTMDRVHCGNKIPWTEKKWEHNTVDRVHCGNRISWTEYTVGTKYRGQSTLLKRKL